MAIETDITHCHLVYGQPVYLENGNIECKTRSTSHLIKECNEKNGTPNLTTEGVFINCTIKNNTAQIIFNPAPIPFNNIVTIPQTVKEANDKTKKNDEIKNAGDLNTSAAIEINTETLSGIKIKSLPTKDKIDLSIPPGQKPQTGRLDVSSLTTIKETHSDGKLYSVTLTLEASAAYIKVKAAFNAYIDTIYPSSVPNTTKYMQVSDSYRPFDAQYAPFDWYLFDATSGSILNPGIKEKVKEIRYQPIIKKMEVLLGGATGSYTFISGSSTIKVVVKENKKGTGIGSFPVFRKKITLGATAMAFPGTSNHGKGITIDLDQSRLESITWMRISGSQYGWSWTEGNSVNEPWHYNYLPNDKRIYSKEGKLLEVKNTTIVPIINSK
jgi:hypothetical protein